MVTETVLLASIASLVGGAPALGGTPWQASSLAALQAPWRALQLAPRAAAKSPLLVVGARQSLKVAVAGPNIDAALPAAVAPGPALPTMNDEPLAALGGFVNIDVMRARHLVAGPELSWLTPESPREDLLRLRVLASGWGIRYSWVETGISAGVAVCTRFVKMGEIDFPVVDRLTSEARIEFALR